MGENETLFLANPINANEKPTNQIFGNHGKINGIDKIDVYYQDCFSLTLMFIFSILFIWFPVVLYILLVKAPYKTIYYIDEEEKELVAGNQGVLGCCMCCIFNKKNHIIKEINKVIIFIESKPNSNKKIVTCEFYMLNGDKQVFFKNLVFKDEKLNEIEAFFGKHFDIQIVDNNDEQIYSNI